MSKFKEENLKEYWLEFDVKQGADLRDAADAIDAAMRQYGTTAKGPYILPEIPEPTPLPGEPWKLVYKLDEPLPTFGRSIAIRRVAARTAPAIIGEDYFYTGTDDGEASQNLKYGDAKPRRPGQYRGDVDTLPCLLRIQQGVPEGLRDDSLFRLAIGCFKDGKSKDEARSILADAAERCEPPFPQSDVWAKVESAYRRGRATLQCGLDFLHSEPTLCSTNCPFYRQHYGRATNDGPYRRVQFPRVHA